MVRRFKLIIFFAILFRFIVSFTVWHPDVNNHVDWGIRFFQYGASKFYAPESNVWSFTWPNQPPGTTYLFAGVKTFSDFVFSIFWWINIKVPPFPSNIMFFLEHNLYPGLLKLPSILADVGIAILIYRVFKDVKKKELGRLGAIVWLINPVVWYNSSVWGQTDSVIAFLVFLSFYLLSKNRITLSSLSFALSLYIKASLAIFIPIYIIYALKKKRNVLVYLKAIAISILFIYLATIPFAKGNPLIWLYNLYLDKIFVQQLQVITANAFNIWATIATIHERPQSLMLGPLTYQMWGNIAFIISYVLIAYFSIKSRVSNIYWSLSLIAISSFMLLTNMHERYLFPFFPFFTILAVANRKYMKVYIILALINLLNLYNFWWVPKINFVVNFLSSDNRLMPRVLGFISFMIYIYLFREFLRQEKLSRI